MITINNSHPAYKYAVGVTTGEIVAPKYVRLQCSEFLQIARGKNKDYEISIQKLQLMEDVLGLMIMAKGLKAGQTVKEAMAGFQWLFLTAVLCTVHRKDPKKRRYQTAILEICRKNSKTFLCGVLFIILLLTEPQFSKFYSVAPDGSLSREVKSAIEEIVKTSPALRSKYKGRDKFRILRDSIQFVAKENTYIPLNYSNSTLDGKNLPHLIAI